MLRAIAGVERPARLSFVGDGPLLRSLKAEADQVGVADRVEFLGNRSDIPEILAQSHVFVLATKWEGFPLSILEAMRAGLPVIASNVGGVPEAVMEGKTGYVVDRGDADTFRDRLLALIADSALRRRMGNAGRRRYETNFTLDHMLRKTMAVYQMAVFGFRAAAVLSLPGVQIPRTRIDY